MFLPLTQEDTKKKAIPTHVGISATPQHGHRDWLKGIWPRISTKEGIGVLRDQLPGDFYSGCDKIIGEFVYIFMDDDEKWA